MNPQSHVFAERTNPQVRPDTVTRGPQRAVGRAVLGREINKVN